VKPIPTRKFIKFLKSIGLEYKRTKGDHVGHYKDLLLL